METGKRKIDLPNVVSAEIIAENLIKPGIKIVLPPNNNLSTVDLMRNGTLTQAIFDEFGFVVLENYPSMEGYQEGEDTIMEASSEEFLHRDKRPQIGVIPGIVTLRLPEQPHVRRAHTAVGNKNQVFQRAMEFIEKNVDPNATLKPYYEYTPMNDVILLRQKIAEVGIDEVASAGVGDEFYRRSCERFIQDKPWGDYFTDGAPFNQLPRAFLHALNQYVEPVIYKHTWVKGGVLMVDNVQMVHGRIPFTYHENDFDLLTAPLDPSILRRRQLRFAENGEVQFLPLLPLDPVVWQRAA